MRNLHVAEVNETKFDSSDLPLTATTFDTSTGDVICAFGPSPERAVVELRRCKSWLAARDSDAQIITSWDAPSPLPELECDQILSLHYFHESSSIAIVLAGGDLIIVREHPRPEQERIEIVGSIDVGISAAQWSWSSSTLAVITRAGSFVLMSQQLEPVNEVTMQEDDLELSKHVSVGWGKKETQFQGKRAKALKDPTMPGIVDEGRPSPNEDDSTTLSWRGDSAFVAVNSTTASKRRVIRVYSVEGVLDSVSEPIDGLESALSWRPHGNSIAVVKRTTESDAKLEVVFFERNGLRHGEFNLRLSKEEMTTYGAKVTLSWNCDSSVLAVGFRDRVQLWTMGNYHYYLKQELRLKTPKVTWHSTDPHRLCVYNEYLNQSATLIPAVDRGPLVEPYDYGLIAVIDGKNLKITPIKHANVPPPMAFFEISAEDNIISCAVSRTCQRIAFLTTEHLYLCKLEMRRASTKDESSVRHATQFSLQKKKVDAFPRPRQVVIQNDDAVYLLVPTTNLSDPRAACYKYLWVNTNTDDGLLKTQDMACPKETTEIVIDTRQEKLFYKTPKYTWNPSSETIWPGVAEASTIFTADVNSDLPLQISLSKDQVLHVDDEVKVPSVTSFAISAQHIIYTTANHLLKFAHLGQHPIQLPPDTPELDERCRAIERGAKLVTAIPSIYAVVLQMPRGNLETIYPRVMVLGGIRRHIEALEYRKAFLACQKHQVDLNILYDHDPERWSANVEAFITQLKKASRIDEFIQKLKDEDVTQTLYPDTSKQEALTNGVAQFTSPASKTNKICDVLISALQHKAAEYQQNTITAHICKRPPDTAAALRLVSSLRQTSEEEADIAIAHLCFLSDANRLYDAALALYDLELALLVAQNAQRDPREYMPFLQSLQAMPELRRKYTIDDNLKNYAKALASLHSLGDHGELQAYTVKHHLYTTAEDLYQHDPAHLNTISRLHADYFASQSKHSDAATLYESLSDYTTAYPLYALAHQWRESLTCACLTQPPLSPSQMSDLARSLASTCAEESRDYRSAATIHLDYLNDPTTAAELLCKSSYFTEATRILSQPSRNLTAQIPRIIDPALTRKFGEIIELIAECQTQLNSQIPRIEELRLKKAEDPLAFYGGDTADGGVDIPDNVSLAPTDASTLGGQSMFTRYGGGAGGSQVSTKFGGTVASNMSRRTSKTKRREERKRARGKKGSVYEEEYLVASVGRLIERVNGTHEEVGRLVSGLRRRGLREQALKVDEIMKAIQTGCEDARRRVWPETVVVQQESTWHVNGEGRPSGADGVYYDSQVEVPERT